MFVNTLSQNHVIRLTILHVFFLSVIFGGCLLIFLKVFLKMAFAILIQASQNGFFVTEVSHILLQIFLNMRC